MKGEYWTMKELGKAVNLTSHQVGKRLKELGLRTSEGRPSQRAFHNGYCAQRWTQDKQHYLWAWEADKILKLLAKEGAGAQSEPPQQ